MKPRPAPATEAGSATGPTRLERAIPSFVGAMAVLVLVVAGVSLGIVRQFSEGINPASSALEHSYAIDNPLCQINDPDLGGISGMATRGRQLWVINDRGSNLFRLTDKCKLAETVSLAQSLGGKGLKLQDVEALAGGPDDWLWAGDVGGNTRDRTTVRLIGYRDAATPLRIATLTYPDGPHDVEALVIDSQERAILITKVPGSEQPKVLVTPLSLAAATKQELQVAGSLHLAKPSGSGPGSRLVTDAALAPTGTNVVLRTYTNAWEFDVFDGEVAAALATGQPRLVPLPESVQGEAITYTQDSTALLATGEQIPVNIDVVQIARIPQ